MAASLLTYKLFHYNHLILVNILCSLQLGRLIYLMYCLFLKRARQTVRMKYELEVYSLNQCFLVSSKTCFKSKYSVFYNIVPNEFQKRHSIKLGQKLAKIHMVKYNITVKLITWKYCLMMSKLSSLMTGCKYLTSLKNIKNHALGKGKPQQVSIIET